MIKRFVTPGAYVLTAIAVAALLAGSLAGQTFNSYQSERRAAMDMIAQGQYAQAMPKLESLLAQNAKDREVLEALGLAVLQTSLNGKTAAARKQERKRGRDLLVRAKDLGTEDARTLHLIDTVPADGGEDADFSFSDKPEVDAAVREGEAAFNRGEYELALKAYERAFRLDPTSYSAALFAGDSNYLMGKLEPAAAWFAKAIAIDPRQELAYRFWGDALLQAGKKQEARDKFIEAFITDPYSRLTVDAMSRWADETRTALADPEIQMPLQVADEKSGKIVIAVVADPKANDGSTAWQGYGAVRQQWMGDQEHPSAKFRQAYPGETRYRHSLAEEVAALNQVIIDLSELQKKNQVKTLQPSLVNLKKIHDAGLIEPFVLLTIVDQGIAEDYGKYRDAHREQLRRYFIEFVIGGGGK